MGVLVRPQPQVYRPLMTARGPSATILPDEYSARLDVLFTGYVEQGDDPTMRVGGTVTLVRDGDRVVIVDPGMVPNRRAILDPLAALGVAPAEVTDVVLSHHHPDHTVNIALFGEVPVHDFQAAYQQDRWTRRPAEGLALSPSVRLLATPGHTPQDLTTLVGTADGVVALTHLWWTAEGPAEDPYAPDRNVLRAQRERILAVADLVVPGHAAGFTPSASTPR